jgi:hypothetical protein
MNKENLINWIREKDFVNLNLEEKYNYINIRLLGDTECP